MSAILLKHTRREFLISTTLAAGGLLMHGAGAAAAAAPDAYAAAAAADTALNAWLRIGADNIVTIIASQAEMGQGIQTTLAAALAEELGADWSRVRLEDAPADPAYRNPRLNWQFTGNSESTTAFFDLMREMGARGREMLIAAAADRWKVDAAACQAARSEVVHKSTGRRATFGELAAVAAQSTANTTTKPTLKAPAEWTLLGKSLPRR